MRKLMFAALAGALALSACGKKEQQQPEVEATNTLVAPPDDNVIDANMVEPAPVEESNVATPAPPPQISEDQQMLDDAAASGMTARLRRGGDEGGEPVAGQGEAAQGDNANMP